MEVSLMKFDLKKAIHEVTYIDVNRPFICCLHPTPEGQNLYSDFCPCTRSEFQNDHECDRA